MHLPLPRALRYWSWGVSTLWSRSVVWFVSLLYDPALVSLLSFYVLDLLLLRSCCFFFYTILIVNVCLRCIFLSLYSDYAIIHTMYIFFFFSVWCCYLFIKILFWCVDNCLISTATTWLRTGSETSIIWNCLSFSGSWWRWSRSSWHWAAKPFTPTDN